MINNGWVELSNITRNAQLLSACAVVFVCMVMLPRQSYGQIDQNSSQEIVFDIQSSTEQTASDDNEELTPEELAAEQARVLEIGRQERLRQAAIIEMQSDLGIYDPALQEAYSDFAAFYDEIEDFESAIRLNTDALQVARINTGLYSAEQRPIIQALVKNNSKLEDWPKVDDLKELDYFVASRLYTLEDPEFIESVEDYGSWKLRVVRENILELSGRGLMDQAEQLSNFYSRLFARIDAEASVEPLALLDVIQDKTQTDLTLARSIARTPFTAFEGTVSRVVTQNRCQNRRNAQGQVVRQCVNVQVENPRYRQSQRDAKNMALRRYTRQIETSIERLRAIQTTSDSLSPSEKQWLESRIAELETESIQLTRSGQRIGIFR